MRYIIIVDDTEFFKTDTLPPEEELDSDIVVIDTEEMIVNNINGIWECITENWED